MVGAGLGLSRICKIGLFTGAYIIYIDPVTVAVLVILSGILRLRGFGKFFWAEVAAWT